MLTEGQFAYWLYSQLSETERETLATMLESSIHHARRAIRHGWNRYPADYVTETVYVSAYLAG